MEIEIKKYNSDLKTIWDGGISDSRNGTFLLYRDYMDYHSSQFEDCSLLFFNKHKLIAQLPANISGDTLYSHQGLTYGGLILSDSATAQTVLDIFVCLKEYLSQNKIKSLIYKSIPHIYHKKPAEEDLYALFRNDAKLVSRSISSCILQGNKIKYSELRNRKIKKAGKDNFVIKESSDFKSFWCVLENNLKQKFGVCPVHNISEIEYLKSKFSDQIHLFEISNSNQVLGGCVVFETDQVAHIQYISASDEGKQNNVLDLLFEHLIKNVYEEKTYFDFGTSTENNGLMLNEGLIFQKEGFGARAITYDIYQLNNIL